MNGGTRKFWIRSTLAVVAVFIALMSFEFAKNKRSHKHTGENQAQSAQSQLPNTELSVHNAGQNQKSTERLHKYKGKVLLINFWATWCEACVDEMPSIVRLRNEFKDQGLEVIAINVDDKISEEVEKKARDLGIDFPIYRDIDEKLASAFDVTAIPFNIVVDRNLNVVWSESGERDWASDKMKDRFREILTRSL